MKRLALLLGALAFAGCGAPTPPSASDQQAKRIVSLDYCADQYVLKLVDPDRILALSPDAAAPESYMRESADGIATVRSRAEDVIALAPDLVVRAHGGGPNATQFFERAGIPVVNVGWAGDLNGLRQVTRDMASALDEPARGEAIVEDMDARLARIAGSPAPKSALYMTPSGVTTGQGGLIHEMLVAAGYSNFEQRPGWHELPLERLAYEQPDVIAAAFFDVQANHRETWSAMRHPIARAQMQDQPTVMLSGAWTACGGWFLIDAIEALSEARIEERAADEP